MLQSCPESLLKMTKCASLEVLLPCPPVYRKLHRSAEVRAAPRNRFGLTAHRLELSKNRHDFYSFCDVYETSLHLRLIHDLE